MNVHAAIQEQAKRYANAGMSEMTEARFQRLMYQQQVLLIEGHMPAMDTECRRRAGRTLRHIEGLLRELVDD